MYDNEDTKKILAHHLGNCILAHNAGDFEKLSEGYEFFSNELIRNDPDFDGIIFIAERFWEEWIVSYEYKWKYSQGLITKDEWLVLAQNVIDILMNKDVQLDNKIAVGFGSDLGKNFSGCTINGGVLFISL